MTGLELRGVRKAFGSNEVIRGIDLTLDDGEFLVLVGPSGWGKSTLLNMIAGLEGIDAGEVRIRGRRVDRVPPKDRDIAMVFQSYALYPTKSVRDNITFGMTTRRVPAEERQRALEDVAHLLHVDELLDRKPGQLSGGQRQRVAMGRALVRDPAVFLFDEPLSNLDAKLRIEMRTEIKRLHRRLGKTVVYVTHDQIEAMTLASRIAVMDRGTIRQIADPETIYNHPDDLFVAGFMGSPPMNMLEGTLVGGDEPAVAIADGELVITIPLNGKLREVAQGSAGRPVVLGVRPEAITTASTNGSGFVLERMVDVTEPTGPDTMLVVDVGGRDVIARVRPEEAVPAGALVRLSFDTDKARLFCPRTGRRLGGADGAVP